MNIKITTARQGDHITEVDCIILATKDSSRESLAGIPFMKLPNILTVGLIIATILLGKNIATEDRKVKKMIPDAIVTGRELIYNKKLLLDFINYIQTYEDDDITITEEITIGDI